MVVSFGFFLAGPSMNSPGKPAIEVQPVADPNAPEKRDRDTPGEWLMFRAAMDAHIKHEANGGVPPDGKSWSELKWFVKLRFGTTA